MLEFVTKYSDVNYHQNRHLNNVLQNLPDYVITELIGRQGRYCLHVALKAVAHGDPQTAFKFASSAYNSLSTVMGSGYIAQSYTAELIRSQYTGDTNTLKTFEPLLREEKLTWTQLQHHARKIWVDQDAARQTLEN